MGRLRNIRLKAGLSQQELGDASGVSQRTISELELGHRKPQGRTLRKLGGVLGVAPEDLYGNAKFLHVMNEHASLALQTAQNIQEVLTAEDVPAEKRMQFAQRFLPILLSTLRALDEGLAEGLDIEGKYEEGRA